jgi:hypothetical protein
MEREFSDPGYRRGHYLPYVPLSHTFMERLIGSIRREYFDHIYFWRAVDRARKLTA